MSVHTTAQRQVRELGGLTARAALRRFAEEVAVPAVGFCYRPRDARWFRLTDDGAATGPDGEPFDLTGAFELRAFTGDCELRWRNRTAGTGPAILVSDAPGAAPEPYHRLLWGAPVAWRDGWVTLADARTSTYTVPVDAPTGHHDRIWLRAVEYTAQDEHGNVAVVDERLVALVVAAPGQEVPA